MSSRHQTQLVELNQNFAYLFFLTTQPAVPLWHLLALSSSNLQPDIIFYFNFFHLRLHIGDFSGKSNFAVVCKSRHV